MQRGTIGIDNDFVLEGFQHEMETERGRFEEKVGGWMSKVIEMGAAEEWPTTAKTSKLFHILDRVRSNDPAEKVVVFCQVGIPQAPLMYLVYRLL